MSYLAEENIIGSLLLDRSCMDDIYNVLSAEMFTSELLGRMYLEFQKGYDNRYDVNPAVIVQKLSGDVFPEQLIIDEIKNCTVNTTTSATVKSYADVIVSEYKARRLDNILGTIKVSPNDVSGQIGRIIASLEALQDGKSVASKALPDIV